MSEDHPTLAPRNRAPRDYAEQRALLEESIEDSLRDIPPFRPPAADQEG